MDFKECEDAHIRTMNYCGECVLYHTSLEDVVFCGRTRLSFNNVRVGIII